VIVRVSAEALQLVAVRACVLQLIQRVPRIVALVALPPAERADLGAAFIGVNNIIEGVLNNGAFF